MRRRLLTAVCSILAAAAAAPAAQARDAIVTSFDGTPIVTHFFPAKGLAAGERAPTIMVGHGWGGSGEDDPDSGQVAHYTGQGYNVLTWDARGFGGSGGTVMIDSPDFEARDAIALIDFVAAQAEARLDEAGDPRLGMDGPSYGGGIQLLTAALDDRVDAIAPTIAWNTLPRSLYPREVVRLGWDLALVGIGIPTSVAPGVFSPAGVQTGHQSPEFYDAVVAASSTGTFPPEIERFFAERGPAHLLDRIRVPTLIVQGTVDTLFTLEEAHRNFAALEQLGIPLRMMWYCGGHGACLTETGGVDLTGTGGLVGERKLAWFERHLKGRSVATGPRFEWIDEEGEWRGHDSYPPPATARLRGEGSGTLALPAGSLPPSGALIFATRAVPSPSALTVPIEQPPEGAKVLGAPTLEIAYSGTGVPVAGNRFEAYAQIVDRGRNVVVNNQATPIPLTLDGQRHEVSFPLERIASLPAAEGYELQLIANTNVYDAQRGAGVVDFERIRVSLPLIGTAAAGGGDGAGDGSGGGAGGGGDAEEQDGGGGSSGGGSDGDGSGDGSTTRDRSTSGGASGGGGELPFTGLAIGLLALAGGALLAIGQVLRRRARV